jgi:isocitrate/isopropylmalate dehydrogenase
MPYDVTILPDARTGLVVGTGDLTGTDLAQACGVMARDAQWENGFDEVWDLTAAAQIDITPEELDRLVDVAHEHADAIGENRVAFVSTRDAIAVLVRLFERRTADLHRTYRVVRTRAEAADWLGVALPGVGG